MQTKSKRAVAAATALAAGLAGVIATGGVSAATGGESQRAKNVIYFVGDGMGVTHIDAARLRYEGVDGRLAMQTLPVSGTTTTYAVQKESDLPELVTDSAASATAWSSGVKSYNGAIGKDAYGNVVPTLMEEAKAAGLRTGNVSTAEITDATPAALMSHVSERGCQGPSTAQQTAACGFSDGSDGTPASEGETPIAQQVSRNGTADVILGGGLQRFEPADADALAAQGYQVLGSFGDPALAPGAQTAESQAVATGDDLAAVTSPRVVGLFNRGNMTVATAKDAAPDSAEAAEPSLAEMTAKAIELLETGDGERGFALQVESALIDKRSHANDAAQTLGETKALDDAVRVALDYAAKGDTLVVVTADHECAGFNIIGQGSFVNAQATNPPGNIDSGNTANNSAQLREFAGNELDPQRSPTEIFNAPGAQYPNSFAPATFATADDPEGVEDGTPEASLWLSYLSGNHTGADVPVVAYGPGSAQFAGLHDNTDNYTFLKTAVRGM